MPQSEAGYRKLTPADVHRHLKALADHHGYRLHVSQQGLTTSTYSDGFPTFALIGHGRLLFLTLADPKVRLTPPAAAWVDELADVETVQVHVIDRSDLQPTVEFLENETDQ